MKQPTIFAGCCVIGLLAGFGLRRAFSETSPSVVIHETAIIPSNSQENRHAQPTITAFPEVKTARTTDSLESILTAEPVAGYARIARWLTTAGEQDIEAYWAVFQKGKRDADITDLIFIHWTRLNPQAAIAGAAAAGNGFSAWQAWAANDPKAALTAALAVGEEQAGYVATGIGRYAPEWLREHFDELPESARHNALSELDRWKDTTNPLASLEFSKKTGRICDEETFRSLVRHDPYAALDWLKENPRYADEHTASGNDFSSVLFSMMAQERPEELEALAARTPPGAAKRQMEQALFDRLLEADPAAALEHARATAETTPLLAAQQLGRIGLKEIATNPEKAFKIAGEILAANPGKIDIVRWIDYPGGTTESVACGEANTLLTTLFGHDRLKTMDLLAAQPPGENLSTIFQSFAGQWANDDLTGLTNWTLQQTGKVREAAARQIGGKLAAEGKFLDSIEWAKSSGMDPGNAYYGVLFHWDRADPAAAAAWLESSDLTGEQKAKYRETLKQHH